MTKPEWLAVPVYDGYLTLGYGVLGMTLGWLLPVNQSWAWNADGHRIVAQIAAAALGPEARAGIERLSGQPAAQAMSTQSVWADTITASRPETRPWHYVNIPLRAESFDWLRDCPAGACVVGALKTQWAKLSDGAESDPVRREALAFVVHFIADLHQPMHCGDGQDRGGNDIVVEVDGSRSNLHRVWDGEFFPWMEITVMPVPDDAQNDQSGREDAARQDGDVDGTSESKVFDATDFVRWAEESHRLALEQIYATLPPMRADRTVALEAGQVYGYWRLARQRIAQAARRLARALDAAFAPIKPVSR